MNTKMDNYSNRSIFNW